MSKLLEKERLSLPTYEKELQKENENKNEKEYQSCLKLTKIMKSITSKQVDAYGRLHEYDDWFTDYRKYYTHCNEFKDLVEKTNNNAKSKIRIEFKDTEVRDIVTKIDVEKDLVTYTLKNYC
jgi:hypothetical protein